MIKTIFAVSTFSLCQIAMATDYHVTKITMDAGPESPTGKYFQMYANGNQQTPLYVHIYTEEEHADPSELTHHIYLYNNNDGKDLGWKTLVDGRMYTDQKNEYKHGIFNKTLSANGAFLGDTQCNTDTHCVTLTYYLQTSNVNEELPVCVYSNYGPKIRSCNESSDSPVIINSINPIIYKNEDFESTQHNFYQTGPTDYDARGEIIGIKSKIASLFSLDKLSMSSEGYSAIVNMGVLEYYGYAHALNFENDRSRRLNDSGFLFPKLYKGAYPLFLAYLRSDPDIYFNSGESSSNELIFWASTDAGAWCNNPFVFCIPPWSIDIHLYGSGTDDFGNSLNFALMTSS